MSSGVYRLLSGTALHPNKRDSARQRPSRIAASRWYAAFVPKLKLTHYRVGIRATCSQARPDSTKTRLHFPVDSPACWAYTWDMYLYKYRKRPDHPAPEAGPHVGVARGAARWAGLRRAPTICGSAGILPGILPALVLAPACRGATPRHKPRYLPVRAQSASADDSPNASWTKAAPFLACRTSRFLGQRTSALGMTGRRGFSATCETNKKRK